MTHFMRFNLYADGPYSMSLGFDRDFVTRARLDWLI